MVVGADRARHDAAGGAADEDPVALPVADLAVAHHVEGVRVPGVAVTGQIADVQAVSLRAPQLVGGMGRGAPRREVRVLGAVARVAEGPPVGPAPAVVAQRDAAEAARVAARPDRRGPAGGGRDEVGGEVHRVGAIRRVREHHRRPVALVLRPGAQPVELAAADLAADLAVLDVVLRDREHGPGAHVADGELGRVRARIAGRRDRAPVDRAARRRGACGCRPAGRKTRGGRPQGHQEEEDANSHHRLACPPRRAGGRGAYSAWAGAASAMPAMRCSIASSCACMRSASSRRRSSRRAIESSIDSSRWATERTRRVNRSI